MDSTPPSKDTVLQTGLKRKIQQSIYKRPILLTEINMGLQRKASKNAIFFLISYVFSSTKSENKRMELVLPRSGTRVVGSKMAQTMYTHVSKCKNIKIKIIKIQINMKMIQEEFNFLLKQKIDNIRKEVEIMKNQFVFLELKNIVKEIKILLDCPN
jgi:chloramphenicol O-acetyltransferase